MSDIKRYFWLRLENDFFEQKHILKMLRCPNGVQLVHIYLKALLKSLKAGGELYFTGLEPSFVEELALELNEDTDLVAAAVAFMLQNGLLETEDNETYSLPEAIAKVGKEGTSTARVRDFRARQKEAAKESTNETQVKHDETLETSVKQTVVAETSPKRKTGIQDNTIQDNNIELENKNNTVYEDSTFNVMHGVPNGQTSKDELPSSKQEQYATLISKLANQGRMEAAHTYLENAKAQGIDLNLDEILASATA